MSVKELREQRGENYEAMKVMVEQWTKEGRSPTAEEQEKWDKLESRDTELQSRIQTADTMDKLEKELTESRATAVAKTDFEAAKRDLPTSRDYRQAFRGWALGSEHRTDREFAALQKCNVDANRGLTMRFCPRQPQSYADIDGWMTRATTAINISTDTTLGANAVANEPMRAIERALLAFGGVREASRVIRTNTGATLQIPTNNDTGNSAVIVGQGATIDVSGMEFGQTTLGSYKYSSQLVKCSVEFLQDLSFDFGSWIGDVLGERVARGLNTDFTIGVSSSGEPAGVATEAIDPASTSTQITYAGLVAIEHRLDPLYRAQPGCRWMMHDSVLRRVKQLVDSQGRMLWMAGMTASEPDRILGYPYTVNQAMATDSTAGATKQILFGDFNHYIVRDVMDIELRRLDERYADQGVVAFFTLSRHDGATVIPSTATPPIIAAQPTT